LGKPGFPAIPETEGLGSSDVSQPPLIGILAWEGECVKAVAGVPLFHGIPVGLIQKNEDEWLARLPQLGSGQEHRPITGLPNLLV